MWCRYLDIVPTLVGRLRTLIKDLDDKFDEKEAAVSKRKLNDRVIEYRENKQALLHNVDLMLDLTNKKRRRLSRSVSEWEEFFVKLEVSWGFWFADVKTTLKGPKDETNKTKHCQMTSGASTNAAHTNKLKQSSFNPTKRNCSVEVTSEKQSLTPSSTVNDEERRVVGASNGSDAINSINDVKVLPEQTNNGLDKATSKSNRTTVSYKSSKARHIILLELEAMKKQDEIDVQLAAEKRQAEIRKKQEEMHMTILAEELEIAKLEESARSKQVTNQELEITRNGIQLKKRQPQKVTEKLQPCKGQQKCYRTFKATLDLNKAFYRA